MYNKEWVIIWVLEATDATNILRVTKFVAYRLGKRIDGKFLFACGACGNRIG
jgi:hypothetical protein